MSVLLETSLGSLVVDLYCDECPLAAKNFLKLCKVSYFLTFLICSVMWPH